MKTASVLLVCLAALALATELPLMKPEFIESTGEPFALQHSELEKYIGPVEVSPDSAMPEVEKSIQLLNLWRGRHGLGEVKLIQVHSAHRVVVAGTVYTICATVASENQQSMVLLKFANLLNDREELMSAAPESIYDPRIPANPGFSCLDETSKAIKHAESIRNILPAEVEHYNNIRVNDLPATYDARTVYPKCADVMNHVTSQGSCGACYAFTAIGAAQDRFCVYDAKAGTAAAPTSYRYSVQDLLSCGSRTKGSVCINLEGSSTVIYANGCEGGSTFLTGAYAVEQGLIPEQCQVFDVEDDPSTADPNDLQCLLKNTNSFATTVKCTTGGRIWSFTLNPNQEALLSGTILCQCPGTKEGYNGVTTTLKVKEKPLQCVVQATTAVEIKCGNTALKLPGAGSYTVDGMQICRCPREDRVNYDKVVVKEEGYGALPSCTRPNANPGCNTPRKLFSLRQAKGEAAIMQAIQDSGSVMVSIDAYYDFQHRYNGQTVYKFPKTVYGRDQAATLSSAQRQACESNPDCTYYLGGHAVVVFGWGQEGNDKFWLGRNSWGDDWGNKGVFKFLRGKNLAGIEDNGVMFYGAPKGCDAIPTPSDGKRCVTATFTPSTKTCAVQNICDDRQRSYTLNYNTGLSQCGLIYTFPPLYPGGSDSKQDLLDCCIASETPYGVPWSTEPGTCFTVTPNRNVCTVTNKCPDSRQLSEASNLRSYYSISGGQSGNLPLNFCTAKLFSKPASV